MKPPMKIQTPCDDKTEFENFEALTKQLLTVSKDELNAKLLSDKQRKRENKTKSQSLKETSR